MTRHRQKDGSLLTSQESFILSFPDRLTRQPEYLRYVSARWELAARATCGTPFIHQAYVNPSPLGQGSSTTTDTSLRRM